jgi:hypothetical protein
MSYRREIHDFILNERIIVFDDNYSSRYYNQIYKFIPTIKDKLKELFINFENENQREQDSSTILPIYTLNPLVVRIVLEIIFQPYSPYTHLSDEYINEKINLIEIDMIITKILQWYSRFKLCDCNIFGLCYNNLVNLNSEIMKTIIKNYLVKHCLILKCNDMKLAYLYYIQENRVASPDELIQFENMMHEIENDPEEFHQKYKHKIPTKNISKLDFKIMNEELYNKIQPVCGLCQDDITLKQEYYNLPCQHLFHKNEKDCLDKATIIDWLKENNVCPICKREIKL